MGQVLHRSATTTEAVRRAIQHSQESMRALARRHGINQKTVAKWKKRESTADRRTGPTVPRSTVLTVEQEAIIVAFRKHTLLPLDDCLYALQATIPQLTRSSLHRCLERHGISRLPDVEGDKPKRKKFDTYPIGFFHIDLAEVRTAEGKLYLFVAIDRTSKFAVVELVEKADMRAAAAFLEALIEAVPYRILSQPTALASFEKLYAEGNLQAKSYALAGFRELSPERFKELYASLPTSGGKVRAMSGCVITSETLRDVAEGLISPTPPAK